MSPYKNYLEHYSPGSHSTHHHYYGDVYFFDRSRASSPGPSPRSNPPPYTSPPRGPRGRRPTSPHPSPGPRPDGRQTGQHRHVAEYRAPSRYNIFGDQLVDPIERREGLDSTLPVWFQDAGRREGRRRAGSTAERVHEEMRRESGERREYRAEQSVPTGHGSTCNRAYERCEDYSQRIDRGCDLGYQYCGEDGESQQRYISETDAETDTDVMPRRYLRRGERIRESGEHQDVIFRNQGDAGREAFSEVTGDGEAWQRALSRHYGEIRALREFMAQILHSKDKKGEFIRLKDGKQAWVRPKKSKSSKVRRCKAIGAWGLVDDVEYRDIEWVQGARVRYVRQIRCL